MPTEFLAVDQAREQRRAGVHVALVADSKLPDVLDSLIRDAQARIAYAKPG